MSELITDLAQWKGAAAESSGGLHRDCHPVKV